MFRREGALAVISTDGRMKVELSGVDAGAGVALNDKLVVTGENFTAEGTVVDLTRQGTSLTLTIQDDSLPMGETVSVATADGAVSYTHLRSIRRSSVFRTARPPIGRIWPTGRRRRRFAAGWRFNPSCWR